ncbi:DinB family protein [Alkalihalobacillus pseudalcaliphilus]|uniref:DinB family protein n=1 Tax=Alkalihalobacillus pseudalcaliphilus TaxID=79884 RepID=UPI00064DB68C|nr:DinB family protein [Alkalihalobacillus pseudalcaliphilus]KMK78112.1 hypothetical protein AB990_01305 [Alkalihalobacillus pseudalcaliphilus]
MNKTFKHFKEMITEVLPLKEEQAERLEAPIKEGKWSIREIVAHLYGWDQFNLDTMVPNMENQASLSVFPDHDSFNEKTLRSVENKSSYELIEMFMATREELVNALTKIEPSARFHIGEGKRAFSAESFTKIFVKHDAHHIKQIKDKLSQ